MGEGGAVVHGDHLLALDHIRVLDDNGGVGDVDAGRGVDALCGQQEDNGRGRQPPQCLCRFEAAPGPECAQRLTQGHGL